MSKTLPCRDSSSAMTDTASGKRLTMSPSNYRGMLPQEFFLVKLY